MIKSSMRMLFQVWKRILSILSLELKL